MTVQYISSRGNVFNLLDFDSAKLQAANFHDYSWDKDVVKRQFGELVSRFTKKAQSYDCTFKFRGSPNYRRQLIEALHFETEYDIVHGKLGRIVWGSDYIECFMVTSKTNPEDEGLVYTENKAKFYCPYPFWIEEQLIEIYPSDNSFIDEDAKGYEPSVGRYGYPYGYSAGSNSLSIEVDHYAPCDFKLIAYGPTTSVSFTINNDIHEVDYGLRANQYMVIDSRQNTPLNRQCYVVDESGRITNVFDYRNPEHELFKKIPSGNIVLTYAKTYGIQLTLFKERSEPR